VRRRRDLLERDRELHSRELAALRPRCQPSRLSYLRSPGPGARDAAACAGILLLVAGVVASNVAASRKQQQQQQQQLGEASRSLPAPGLAGGRGAGGSEPEAPSGSELYDISIAMQPGGAEAGGAARGKGSPHGALCEIAGAEKGGPREAGGSPLSGSGVAGLAPALAAAAGPGSLAGGEDRWF